MTIQVTILGLNRIGASIGLALTSMKDQITRVGSDRELGVARQAEKMGAVDKVMINLPSSVENADVVIMALPVNDIRATMEVIAPDMKPGAVLVDTSPVKDAVAKWAKELLPGEDRYFVSMSPSLNPAYLYERGNGVENAHADLFKKGIVVITSPVGTDESALNLAANLTKALDATPLFSDPVETDGLLLSSQLLPGLTAAALVNATVDQPGWREARKLAGAEYAQTSEAVMHLNETEELGLSALLNGENAARMLDQVINELSKLREALHEQDAKALQERLEHAQQARSQWMKQRSAAEWEPKPDKSTLAPSGGEMIGRLFGIRPKRDKERKK